MTYDKPSPSPQRLPPWYCRKRVVLEIDAPFARFLHPSKVIQGKWPNDWKVRKCPGAIITGKGMHNVSCKQQICYEVCIPKIDDGIIFKLVMCNFSVITEGPPQQLPHLRGCAFQLPFWERSQLFQ